MAILAGVLIWLGYSISGGLFAAARAASSRALACFGISALCATILASLGLPSLFIGWASRETHNRNAMAAFAAGFASVWVAYAVLFSIQRIGAVSQGIELPLWGHLLEAGYCIIASSLSGIISMAAIHEQYYCETCQRYLENSGTVCWPANLATEWTRAIDSNRPALIGRIAKLSEPIPGDDRDCCRVELRSCPKCEDTIIDVASDKVVDKQQSDGTRKQVTETEPIGSLRISKAHRRFLLNSTDATTNKKAELKDRPARRANDGPEITRQGTVPAGGDDHTNDASNHRQDIELHSHISRSRFGLATAPPFDRSSGATT